MQTFFYLKESYKPITKFFGQLVALTLKNLLFSFRHPFATVFQILVPSLLLFSFFLSDKLVKEKEYFTHNYPVEFSGRKILYSVDYINNVNLEKIIEKMAGIAGLKYDTNLDRKYSLDTIAACKVDFCRFDKVLNVDYFIDDFYWDFGKNQSKYISDMFFLTYDKREGEMNEKKNASYIRYYVLSDLSSKYMNPFAPEPTSSFAINDNSLYFQSLYFQAMIELKSDSSVKFKVNRHQLIQDTTTGSSVFLHMIIILGILLGTVIVHFKINYERDADLKKGLLLNNLSSTNYLFSWFISEVIMCFICVLLLTITGLICQFDFFIHVNLFILFMVFFIFGVTCITVFMCSSVCIKGTVGTTISSFCYMLLCIGMSYLVLNSQTVAKYMIYSFVWVYLIPAYHLSKCLGQMEAILHQNGVFKFVDFWIQNDVVFDKHMNPFLNIVSLVGLVFIFYFFMFYLDLVLPSTEKVRKSMLFLCSQKYWGVGLEDLNVAIDYVLPEGQRGVIPDLDPDICAEYRNTMLSLKNDAVPLKIVKTSKTFTSACNKSRNKLAVSEITMYGETGKILVILGHNGAGKTTLINMITGSSNPTCGDIVINGKALSQSIQRVKNDIGVCPQFNICWNELTVKEHLYFFALLKGISFSDAKRKIDEIIDNLGLKHVENQYAKLCSGGEKRRLTFGFSIIDNPPVLVLDEPSCGLDPIRKQKLWNYLIRIKKDRIIILTTHSMEEADVVGDKIAFLALSRLRAIGDRNHLKERFGFGYQLQILFKKKEYIEDFKREVLNITRKLILNSEVNCFLNYTMSFSLSEEVKSKLFKFIEDVEKQDKIHNFQLSHTTIEEVFMNVTHGNIMLRKNTEESTNRLHKLNVMIESESVPFITLEVGKLDTLGDVRDIIHRSMKDKDFIFVHNSIPILKSQELDKNASSYSPLIMVRVYEKIAEKTSGSLGRKYNDTKMKVENQEETINEQQSEIEKLKLELARLKSQK